MPEYFLRLTTDELDAVQFAVEADLETVTTTMGENTQYDEDLMEQFSTLEDVAVKIKALKESVDDFYGPARQVK